MTHFSIQSIYIIDQQVSIIFQQNWFQEDIKELSQLILSTVSQHQIKEKIVGADRESLRFLWQRSEFILNFDCYSQSCWISAHDIASKTSISVLYKLLSTGISISSNV